MLFVKNKVYGDELCAAMECWGEGERGGGKSWGRKPGGRCGVGVGEGGGEGEGGCSVKTTRPRRYPLAAVRRFRYGEAIRGR